MKNGHLYHFNDVNGIEVLIGVLKVREVFVNKSFMKQNYVLISLSHNFKNTKELHWNDLSAYLSKKEPLSVSLFTKDYMEEIQIINKFKEKQRIELSWLETFQIAAILRLEQDKSIDVTAQIHKELRHYLGFINDFF